MSIFKKNLLKIGIIFILGILLNLNYTYSAWPPSQKDYKYDGYGIGGIVGKDDPAANLSEYSYQGNAGFLCIEHGQALHQTGIQYTVREQIHIDGKLAVRAYGVGKNANYDYRTTSIYNENAVLAYILQTQLKTFGVTQSKKDEPVQNAIWDYIKIWYKPNKANFANFTNEISCKQGNSTTYGELITYANNYANAIIELGDGTDKSKVVVTPYENGGETYVRIGPFKINYDQTLKAENRINLTINLIDEKNTEITPTGYGRYIGANYQQFSNANDIGCDQEFYVEMKVGDSQKITGIKVRARKKVCIVDVTFFEATGDQNWQNLIRYGNMEVTERTDEITSGYNIELLGKLALSKIDADSKKPLDNVGFTLKMTSGIKKGQYVGINGKGNAIYSSSPITIKTDANGKININNVYPGTYELIEVQNATHYGYEDLPAIKNENLVIQARKNRRNKNRKQKNIYKIIRICMGRLYTRQQRKHIKWIIQ